MLCGVDWLIASIGVLAVCFAVNKETFIIFLYWAWENTTSRDMSSTEMTSMESNDTLDSIEVISVELISRDVVLAGV
jgi:hypothetical protein